MLCHFMMSLRKHEISPSAKVWFKWTSDLPEGWFLEKHGVLGSINHLSGSGGSITSVVKRRKRNSVELKNINWEGEKAAGLRSLVIAKMAYLDKSSQWRPL